MDDHFDAFGEEVNKAPEEDPAAEFLAREQDQLAEIEDENFGFGEPNQDAFGNGPVEGFENGFVAVPPNDDLVDEFGGPPVDTQTDLYGGDEYDPYSQTDDAVDKDEVPEYSSQNDDIVGAYEQNDASGYSAIQSVDQERKEPEKLRLWREEQKKRLEQKDEESELKRLEWLEIAKRELEDWYRHRSELVEKTKKNNREAEAQFVHKRDECLPGHEWEAVCRLCEFNPKISKASKDTSRMRSILLQLKQTPLIRSETS